MVAQSSLTSTSKPSAPFRRAGFEESFCMGCGVFAAVPQFSRDAHFTPGQWLGADIRALALWKAAALCLYEFQAHIKYEGSLSTQINFGDNPSSPHIANEGRESGGWKKKEGFGEYMALTVQSTLNYSCLLATKIVKAEQGKLLYYSTSHQVQFKGRQVLPDISFKHRDAKKKKQNTSKNDKLRLYKQFQYTALLKEYVLNGSSSNKSLLLSLQQ